MIYDWKDSWDWNRIRKIRRQKGIGQARPDNPDKFYAAIKRAINTRHKTLIHEMIDNYKKDGYTFGVERRKSKTGRIYNGYLYRQKRNINGKTKEHVCLKAKDLNDYRDNVLLKQARMEVYRDKVGASKKGVSEISIDAIQEVTTDIGTLIDLTAKIRVKNSKIKSFTDGINEDIDEIKSAVSNYQRKLKSAIVGIDANNDGE